jgi:plasmid stabilization system protein ParE
MDYKVILSPLALADLEQIVRYIASRDPAAAGRLGTRLLDQAETLCRLPHRGGPVRQRPGVRKLVLRPYLTFYRVDDAARRVDVLRFWHGAQDPRSLRLE